MTARIVHVASGREWRGGQRQVWLLARELQRLNVRDQIVITGAGTELAQRLAADGVRVRAVPWRAGLDPRAFWAIRREIRGDERAGDEGGSGGEPRPTLLHAHDAHALTLAGLARASLPNTGHGHARLIVTRRVTFPLRRRGFWTRADRVIAISQAVRHVLLVSGVPSERIEVIPSGVDPAAVRDTADFQLHTLLDLPSGTPLALTIAALTPEKDHDTLLKAAARVTRDVPALRWVIVGDGPTRDALLRRIGELGLERTVSLLPGVPDPERLLTGASVFVLSSTAEGLGSSVLAAWARGIPVVATRVGGLAELLGSGAGLLVGPRDPAAIADAVLRVVTDADLRERLAQRGGAEVRHYEIRGMAERVLTVYRSVENYDLRVHT